MMQNLAIPFTDVKEIIQSLQKIAIYIPIKSLF